MGESRLVVRHSLINRNFDDVNAVLLVALLHRREQTLRTGDAMPVRTVAFRVANEVWITVIETEFLQAHTWPP